MSSNNHFESFTARLGDFIRVSTQSPAVDGDFEQLALELFALQYQHNWPYRQFCDRRGVTPRGLEHWSRIPAVLASAFKDLELTCLPAAERAAVDVESPERAYEIAARLSAGPGPGGVSTCMPIEVRQIMSRRTDELT